jgi:hypothetical protein
MCHTFTGWTRKKVKISLAIAIPVAFVMLAITIFCLCFLRMRRRLAREHEPPCKLPSQYGTINNFYIKTTINVEKVARN